MKIKVEMKDADALYQAIKDTVNESIDLSLPDDEREAIADCRIEKAQYISRIWFKWGEYLTLEIDTDAETCVVIPKGKELI